MFVETDLHGHTLYSDARATPGSFVRFRAELGMKLIAISDHDVFTASRAGLAACEDTGMIFIPAAELTSFLHFGRAEAEQFHVLGYFPPSHFEGDRLEETALYRRGLAVQERWKIFVLEWLAGLPEEDRAAISGRGVLAGVPAREFPALQPMIDRLLALRPAWFDAFRRHHVRFWSDNPDLFSWTPEELIDTIRADGGVDIVAHAVRYHDRDRLEQVLEYASGVEVYTSRHNEKVAARFRAYAEENGKLWTASSDDHQHVRYIRPPCGTPVSTVERILRTEYRFFSAES